MTTEPEEVEEVDEEIEAAEDVEAALDGKVIEAEVFLRYAWDLLDDLLEAKRVPQRMVDQVEKLHAELVDLMPDD